jgi:hypothetical protein
LRWPAPSQRALVFCCWMNLCRRLPGTRIAGPAGRPTAKLAIRPEDMRLSAADPDTGNRLQCRLVHKAFAVAKATAVFEWRGAAIKTILPTHAMADPSVGQMVWAL